MFGGLLAFLGIYGASAAKAAKDNYELMKTEMFIIWIDFAMITSMESK